MTTNTDTEVEVPADTTAPEADPVVTEPETTAETETPTKETSEPTSETPKEPEPSSEPAAEESTEGETLERVVPAVEDYELADGLPRSLAVFANENDMTQSQLDNTIKELTNYTDAQRVAEQKFMFEEGSKVVESWGDKSQSNLSLIKRALDHHDPDGEVAQALDATGYGNHPVMLKFLLRMGESLQEGGFITSAATPPSTKKTAASVMFGGSHPSANQS